MASDYQGETIQVFVFFRGKFLGYQCFGQDRLTVGGASGMDLPLPDCPEEEGFWDVYVSRGALYAWLRSPAGGNGKEGHPDPRKVQPLDSLSLGEYRLQAKLLEGQGFEEPSAEPEEELIEPEIEAAFSPDEEIALEEPHTVEEEEEREEQELGSSEELGEEEGPEPEVAWEAVDEVEGISLDYARSIWKGETEDERAEAAEVESGEVEAEAPPTEPVEAPAPVETIEAQEEGLPPDDAVLALAGEAQVEEPEEVPSLEAGEPDDPDDELPGMEEIDDWIGFGQEEEEEALLTPAEEETPDVVMEKEPYATTFQKLTVGILKWLPIDSQL